MRKVITLLVVLALALSLGAPVWADETGAQDQNQNQNRYRHQIQIPEPTGPDPFPEDLAAPDEFDVTSLFDELGLPPGLLGLRPLPSVKAPDAQERDRLHKSIQALVYEDFESLDWQVPSLVATSRKLATIAVNRAVYFNNNPGAKEIFVRLCDQMVRLNASLAPNDQVKRLVYRNMAEAYYALGCYHRAAACLERAYALGDKQLGNSIKHLYRNMNQNRNQLKVFVNGRHPDFDVPPQIMNGRTMVPLRALAEALGCEVDYENGKITFNRNGREIVIYINNPEALVSGKKVKMDQPPRIMNGRTLVPLRFLSENMDASVDYDAESGMITVDDDTGDDDNGDSQ